MNELVAAVENVPSDEVYEKAVNMATVVYQLEGEGEQLQFVPIHENGAKMLQVSILHPTKVSSTVQRQMLHLWVTHSMQAYVMYALTR